MACASVVPQKGVGGDFAGQGQYVRDFEVSPDTNPNAAMAATFI